MIIFDSIPDTVEAKMHFPTLPPNGDPTDNFSPEDPGVGADATRLNICWEPRHKQAQKAVSQWAKPGQEESRIRRVTTLCRWLNALRWLSRCFAFGVTVAAVIKIDNPTAWKPLLISGVIAALMYVAFREFHAAAQVHLSQLTRGRQ